MLMRTALTVLGLTVFIACGFGDDKDGKAAKHLLAFIGDQGVAEGGKGNIELQLKYGDKAVTDAEGIEVTLTVVCGENTQAFKGKLNKDGKAEVAVDISNWNVDDWGACKVSADVTVGDKDVSATEVEIKTVGQEQGSTGTCEEEGGCDEQGNTFQIGQELSVLSLGDSTLSLHCSNKATLYTVEDDTVKVAKSNVVDANEAGAFPVMFVLGMPGDNCMLKHSPDGTTLNDYAKIVAAQDTNLAVANLSVTLSNNSGTVRVTLPAKPSGFNYLSDNIHIYVSSDGGGTWSNKQEAVWNGNPINTDATWNSSEATLVLLRVSVSEDSTADDDSDTARQNNSGAYWSLHVYTPSS